MTREQEYKIFVNELKRNIKAKDSNIVFLCVGSNRIIGDSFGPMVGTKLKNLKLENNITIIGDMAEPVCANNIYTNIRKIKDDSYVIVIDSALSEYEAEGIYVSPKEMALGSGINKTITKIGDISIKGCVGKRNIKTKDNLYELYKVYKSKIYELSNIVSEGIFEILSEQLW